MSHKRGNRERKQELVILIGLPGDSLEAWTHPDVSAPYLVITVL